LYAEFVSHSQIENQRLVLPPAERRRLLSLAYGYLGTLADSEDIVQEALLRLAETDPAGIENTEAWLTTVVTRLAIDKLRSAQHRREVYTGEWLPEPLFRAPDAEQQAITHSRLSVGLLYLLEKLEPEQRVVFVLREVFDYPYGTIAGILGKSEAACRQLMVRARAALERSRHIPPAPQALESSLISRFMEALSQGDQEALLSILADDAMLVGDGGGKVPSVLNPLHGADHVSRFFLGLLRKFGNVFETQPAMVNGRPGMLTFREGQLISVASIDVENGRIAAIYAVNNPDKLRGGWTEHQASAGSKPTYQDQFSENG
jgi:RNA polymerase sigma-70 factor, ECF subfamily